MLIIRAISSQKAAVLLPTQPASVAGGSAAESSKSGGMKNGNEGDMSDDVATTSGQRGSQSIALASVPTREKAPKAGVRVRPSLERTVVQYTPEEVNAAAFVLPDPALPSRRPAHYTSRKAARELVKKPERVRRVFQRHSLKPIPTRPSCPQPTHIHPYPEGGGPTLKEVKKKKKKRDVLVKPTGSSASSSESGETLVDPTKPPTQASLRAAGGTLHLHEWNALIHTTGYGLRKTTVRHYECALSFFRDMTKGRAPGTTLELEMGSSHTLDEGTAEPVEPDIYTYTTLIGIAARTKDTKCLRHARTLLEHSGIPPNRFTHLALMSYFSTTKQLGAVRSTLLRLERDRMDVGLDGINAFLQAYSTSNRPDVTMMIYRLLRHNLEPDLSNAEEETKRLDEYRSQLKIEEFIVIPDYLIPNAITYTSMIQNLAYHGHLSASLTIFTDMLTTSNTEPGAPLVPSSDGGEPKPAPYQPTAATFRAIFLGFRRHTPRTTPITPMRLPGAMTRSTDSGWTLDNLQKIFDLFMCMPPDMQVGRSIFYWIILAFQSISGDDVELVRDVWKRLEERFKDSLGGKDNRLRRMHASLFPEEASSPNHNLEAESGERKI
ncbi:hypothetical protein C0991_004158 [Blastosporella zonata]|nr:hypothetical protein C0991_004158 [Blastosporella zonata]